MKKTIFFLSLLLIISLLFTACAPKGIEAAYAKEHGCFYFPGTDWGIIEEQLYEALGKTAEDFKREERDNEVFTITELTTDEFKFMGEKHKAIFTFCNFLNTPDDKRLIKVVIEYDMGGRTPEEFKDDVSEYLKTQNPEFSTFVSRETGTGRMYAFTFLSESDMMSLPQKIRDGYNGYVRYLIENKVFTVHPKTLECTEDFTKGFNRSLSSVSIQYGVDEEEGKCGIFFDGSALVQAEMYAEAYSELNG